MMARFSAKEKSGNGGRESHRHIKTIQHTKCQTRMLLREKDLAKYTGFFLM
jgi:hypothetical protein